MPLTLYNTMTRSKDVFEPLAPPAESLYTCGLTVYNYAHIGNLRTYFFEDILVRALKLAGFEVRRVMNVTDVGHLVSDADEGEDKMEKGSRREGRTAWEIAEFYQAAFEQDLARLNCLPPDIWCKATDHITEQIDLVRELEDKGFTYRIDGDGVYFDTSKLDDYGKLARLDLEGLRAGARVEMVVGKRNPTDFALWKFSPADQQRQMEWPSPWGVGFPGWHIECTAMAMKYLGERLDIHCGGIDHLTVHHTNEIAQAESVLCHDWCNWWMHGEWLVIPSNGEGEGQKMSKSTGEFLTLQLLAEKGYAPLAYRYFLLQAHYRQQLAFTWEALDGAANAYRNLKRAVLVIRPSYRGDESPIASHIEAFRAAIMDDLNTPKALAAMWAALKDPAGPGEIYATLREMDAVLGLGFDRMEEEALDVDPAHIDALLAERTEARKTKNFARADEIRDELDALGIEIMDAAGQTTWRKK